MPAFLSRLLLCALLAAIAACGDAGSSPEASGERRAYRYPNSAPVEPSGTTQRFVVNGIGVTLPGGAIATPGKLSVERLPVESVDRFSDDMRTLGYYDIRFSGQAGFERPVVLEFPYDPSVLDDAAAQGKNLFVATWDEERSAWKRVEAEVDTARRKLIVRTGHFSRWSVYRLAGYDYVPKDGSGNFDVYFNPRLINLLEGAPDSSMKTLAETVLAALETARSNFSAAGFKVPGSRLSVFVGDVLVSKYIAAGGALDLRRLELLTLDRLRAEATHEYFHAVQNEYFFTGGSPLSATRLWLTEGTPDFMAYVYGWNEQIEKQFDALDLTWLRKSPFTNSSDHAYVLAHFLDYLRTAEGVDVAKVFVESAAAWLNVDAFFRNAIAAQAGKSFDTVWNDFVEDAVFGARNLARGSGASERQDIRIESAQGEGGTAFSLEAWYTAAVSRISVASCPGGDTRKTRLRMGTNLSGASGVQIWTMRANGTDRKYIGLLARSGEQTDELALDDSVVAYAVAFNNTASAAPVTLSAITTACVEEKTYGGTYPNVALYNSDFFADVSISLSGNWMNAGTTMVGSMPFVRLSVPKPAPNATATISVDWSISPLRCRWEDCIINWNYDGQGNRTTPYTWVEADWSSVRWSRTGSSRAFTLTNTFCSRSEYLYFDIRTWYAGNPPTSRLRNTVWPIIVAIDCY